MAPDWGETMRSIVDDWLFSDVDGELPHTVVLPLENPDLHDPKPWLELLAVERVARSVTIGTLQGRRIGVLTAKFGGPAAAMVVDAAAARGVQRVIGIGFCGAVADDLACGDLLAPVAAVADDGTSARYAPERYPAVADETLHAAVCADGDVRSGLVWSVDSVFAEDSAFVERCRALGVAGIDMETAAVYTVARLRGIGAVTVLVASDHPGRGTRTDPQRLAAGVRRATEVAATLAARC